jgi:Transposase IS4
VVPSKDRFFCQKINFSNQSSLWCIVKTLTFEHFYKLNLDSSRVRKWFSSWKRWINIKRFFKVSDPAQDDANKHDKLFKVKELFEYFISACRSNYWPNCEVALDEAVKKFKGRCSFKQYIKNKPVKWGIKIFCVCCSQTSYLWNAQFYVGKTQELAEQENQSKTQKTVLDLMRPLNGKNHRVYMDNYYTSIPLFQKLQDMSVYSTGTVRSNRKGLDKRVTMTKAQETQLKKNPGSTRYSSCGNLVYASWFDKRPVHMLSNCHPPVGDDVVQHWFPARRGEMAQTASGKILKEISICPIVKWYRKWMGAVDRFDQFRAYIRLEMRTGKFWHVMFWFIVESALTNAFILYKVSREFSNLAVEYSLLEFRIAIVSALAAEWESMGCMYVPTVGPVVASPNSMLKVSGALKLRKHFGCNSDLKFKSMDLHLSFLEDIPLKQGSKLNCRQLRCVNEGCKTARTTKWCRACSAPLCFPTCFQEYHTK